MDYKVGDKVWIIPGYRLTGLIAIECTIVDLHDEFRKIDPNAYMFYWVDEPTGHFLDKDELLSKEEAIEELLAIALTCFAYEPENFNEDVTLEEFRESSKNFIMGTWHEDNPVWTVEYPDKQKEVEWFNVSYCLAFKKVKNVLI